MKGYDIIILAGQSNSAGIGKGEAEKWVPDPDILYLNAPKEVSIEDGKIKTVFLDDPFEMDIADERISAEGEKIRDLSLSFSKAYKENGMLEKDRKILILRCGIGGTGFLQGNWHEKGDLYLKMLEMIDYALSLKGENRLVAFLWHQGEDDIMRNNAPENYEKQLGYLIDSVRGKYGVPTLPFIAGEFIEDWSSVYIFPERITGIVGAIKKVLSARKNTAYVSSKGLLSNRQVGAAETDDIHFCKKSIQEFGIRYFNAYKEIKK